ncbi:unnamed protein product [Oncorhynchus mykiss]|uniref:Caskin-1 CASK-interaction domain-containing protein n=1 Tax=Oncorhynchus mykiss TaxID=8022 RepID=A0A060ZVG4_ONCMY|nr:unnamed protein product [Oncorhynchus mykiss]
MLSIHPLLLFFSLPPLFSASLHPYHVISTSNHQLALTSSLSVSYLFDPVGGTLSRHASLPTQRHQLLSRAPHSSSLSSAPQTDDSYTLYTPNNPHMALPHAIGLSANPAGDRNSVGSTGSVGSTRSAGSGQSTESNTALNGQHHQTTALPDTAKPAPSAGDSGQPVPNKQPDLTAGRNTSHFSHYCYVPQHFS